MLKPGVTLAQANAQMKLAYAAVSPASIRRANPQGGFAVEPLRDSIVGDVAEVAAGAAGRGGAGAADRLRQRGESAAGAGHGTQEREFAIRSALGASRARIMRQLLTESVMLAVTGGVLGLVLGFAGVRALLAISPAGLPRIGEDGSAIGVDWRVLGFTLGVSLLTGILFRPVSRAQRFAYRFELFAEGEQQPRPAPGSGRARRARCW